MSEDMTYSLSDDGLARARQALLEPASFHSPADLRADPTSAPRRPGVYVWYFDPGCLPVPTDNLHIREGRVLLYVGICPAKSADPLRPSKRTLRDRMRDHCSGPAAVSTLRRSLGALLAETLSLTRHPKGSARKWTFGPDGEQCLSDWMAEHAQVVWGVCETPWLVEDHLIGENPPPLNLKGVTGAFRDHLSRQRAHAVYG